MAIIDDSKNEPEEWSIVAQNLPEHARNPIHTDAGAQAAGFPRALVAGVTTYAYMTHPEVDGVRIDVITPDGAIAELDAVVVRRFEAHGERAIIDIHISVEGEVVASLEHEAIVALPGR